MTTSFSLGLELVFSEMAPGLNSTLKPQVHVKLGPRPHLNLQVEVPASIGKQQANKVVLKVNNMALNVGAIDDGFCVVL